MEIIKMPIGDIKPYPNNPRRNDDAVAAVMESIKQCGYCAPIVVDEEGVVLAGLTRLKALKKLGRKEAEVCVVLDNPPFSIISKICAWYDERGIKYFLFAPTLTLFNANGGKENYVVSAARVIYENGAVVNTSFATNLGDYKIEVAPELRRAIESANANKKAEAAVMQKIEYPPNVCTAAILQKLTTAGVSMQIRAESCVFIHKIDAQGADGTIFGGGFLLSDSVTAEKAAAERAAAEKMALSDRERKIVEGLV